MTVKPLSIVATPILPRDPAPSPAWQEDDRLAALRRYDILDSPTEGLFADIVQIAAQLCAAPIALVSFLDGGRQWFGAELGLGIRETPIEQSVCAHAIRESGVFVVPDLARDPRFCDNPIVTGKPNLRFYGGAPLLTADGLPVGTVCVLDDIPRPDGLTPAQAQALQALARQVMAQLDLRRALRERAAMVEEKDLLVQEVHHRVKNSLATVQALLLMQARMTDHTEAAQQLHDSAGRIRTFGALHEQLYRVGATAEVDLSVYLKNLLDEQRAAQAGARAIVLEAPAMTWPSADAPTLGLILTELVTNALKYGSGTITVTLCRSGEDAVLSVEDEGAGMPPGFDPSASHGFGMRIVTGLLRNQGRGRLEIDRGCGHSRMVVTLRAVSQS
jgi:two-component sensor histidine kinase